MIKDSTQIETTGDAPTFIGLKAYTEEQSKMFFGRDEEIQALYQLIKSHTITIVFGKSGTGKTSLLNAGVFPKLRKDYCLPFRIRLEFTDECPDLLGQVKQVLKSEIDKYGFKVSSYPGEETLWEYFHREPLWQVVTPVLVFDQFEEIFTLASKSARFKKEELDVFIEELADLAENSIPEKLKQKIIDDHDDSGLNYSQQKAKIVFAFREDFLAEIESITSRIPSVKYSRFRLKPMNGMQANEVITKTWKQAIQPSEATKIVYFLTNEGEADNEALSFNKQDILEVEPSLLSQVCSYIDKERLQEGQATISSDFLAKYPKGKILRSLYEEVVSESARNVNDIPAEEGKTFVNPIKVFVEENLITDDGFRTRFLIKEIDENLLPGVDVLKRKYYVREEGQFIELTHDVIVPLVKADREQRRKQIALLEAKQKASRKHRQILFAVAFIGILLWVGVTFAAWKEKRRLEKEIVKQKDEKIHLSDDINLQRDSLNHLLNSIKNLKPRITKAALGETLNVQPITAIDSLEKEIRSVVQINSELKSKIAEQQEWIDNREIQFVNKESISAGTLQFCNQAKDSMARFAKNDMLACRINNEKLQAQIAGLKDASDSIQFLLVQARHTIKNQTTASVKEEERKRLMKGKIFGYDYDYPAFAKTKKRKQ